MYQVLIQVYEAESLDDVGPPMSIDEVLEKYAEAKGTTNLSDFVEYLKSGEFAQ